MTNPTKKQRERWNKIASLGCAICGGPANIHHALTGAGGRKDHDKVLPLCYYHHQGPHGIHFMGRKKWQSIYGDEKDLLEQLEIMLAN